jgi:hypothetical protein
MSYEPLRCVYGPEPDHTCSVTERERATFDAQVSSLGLTGREVMAQSGVAGAIAGFFTVSRVWGNVPGGMIFDFVNKNNLL